MTDTPATPELNEKPLPSVDIACPKHDHRPVTGCQFCPTAADVQAMYHNENRCIPATCPFPGTHR